MTKSVLQNPPADASSLTSPAAMVHLDADSASRASPLGESRGGFATRSIYRPPQCQKQSSNPFIRFPLVLPNPIQVFEYLLIVGIFIRKLHLIALLILPNNCSQLIVLQPGRKQYDPEHIAYSVESSGRALDLALKALKTCTLNPKPNNPALISYAESVTSEGQRLCKRVQTS